MTQLITGKPVYLNHILDNFFNHDWFNVESYLKDLSIPSYPHNIYTIDDGTAIFEVAASGVDKKDIDVNFNDGVLNIKVGKGKEVDEEDQENKHYICHKIAKREINLSYTISDKFDVNKTKVNLDKGLLTVEIPLKEESKPVKKSFTIN